MGKGIRYTDEFKQEAIPICSMRLNYWLMPTRKPPNGITGAKSKK